MSDPLWNEAWTAHQLRAGRAVKRMHERVEQLYAELPERVRRVAGVFGPAWQAYQVAHDAEVARCERAIARSRRKMLNDLGLRKGLR